jgi:hypothetical protein
MEDRARLDLERRNAEMRAFEDRAGQQRRLAASLQHEAVQILSRAGSVDGVWQANVLDAELARLGEVRLTGLADAARPGVEQGREELILRRRERRQVEILHTAAIEEEEKRQIRRDQNRTDDWFQSRSTRAKDKE